MAFGRQYATATPETSAAQFGSLSKQVSAQGEEIDQIRTELSELGNKVNVLVDVIPGAKEALAQKNAEEVE